MIQKGINDKSKVEIAFNLHISAKLQIDTYS